MKWLKRLFNKDIKNPKDEVPAHSDVNIFKLILDDLDRFDIANIELRYMRLFSRHSLHTFCENLKEFNTIFRDNLKKIKAESPIAYNWKPNVNYDIPLDRFLTHQKSVIVDPETEVKQLIVLSREYCEFMIPHQQDAYGYYEQTQRLLRDFDLTLQRLIFVLANIKTLK